MNPNDSHRKLESELRDFPVPEPPQGLLEKLKAEVPDSATLAGKAGKSSAPTAAAPSRWPLRLAATFVLAAVGATVAWQVVKSREGHEFDRQAAEFAAPVAQDQSLRSPAAPPPAAQAPKAIRPSRSAEEAAPRPSEIPASSDSLAERLSVKGKQQQQVVQPLTVPEAVASEEAFADAGVEGGVEGGALGGVEGGVAGGVAGGVYGGVVGGVAGGSPGGVAVGSYAPAPAAPPMSAAAPKPAAKMNDWVQKVEKDGRFSVAYDAIQLDGEGRGREVADRREPTSRPRPDTMIFRETPAHRFVSTDDDRQSTFALDVDTGSYTLTRGYLDRGLLPPLAAIRVEEFVNAQSYDDPAPRPGRYGRTSDFALYAEGAEAPFYPGERTRLLRFAVKAREIDARDRKPAVLTFVVDISGSMDQENRLGLVKRALGLLLDELQPEDRVGLVVYGSEGRVLLRHTRDLEEIRRAIARLEPEGSTNAEAGLRLAYDLADEGWRQGASNRILLCSDGVANVGATGPESILARIGKEAQRGIALTTIGFGMGNYNDALMEQLADQGDGTYHYVDQLDEARRVFVENLTGTLETVAKEAKAQVEFDPEAVARYRLLGYENRDVADRDFRNDRIDAGELGAGHQATALYEVRLRPGVSGGDRIATLRLRWKSVESKAVEEESRELRARDLDGAWEEASANLRQAALAAAFAEKLRETGPVDDLSWRALAREARAVESDRRKSSSARDLTDSIERAARIAGVREGDEPRRRPPGDREEERRRNPRLDED